MKAVRLAIGGQAVSVKSIVLGISKATLDNWVHLSAEGQLKGAGDKPVSALQLELARLRAQLACVTMERDILKKPRRTLPGNLCELRLDSQQQSTLAHRPGLRGVGRKLQRLL
jgi:transposase